MKKSTRREHLTYEVLGAFLFGSSCAHGKPRVSEWVASFPQIDQKAAAMIEHDLVKKTAVDESFKKIFWLNRSMDDHSHILKTYSRDVVAHGWGRSKYISGESVPEIIQGIIDSYNSIILEVEENMRPLGLEALSNREVESAQFYLETLCKRWLPQTSDLEARRLPQGGDKLYQAMIAKDVREVLLGYVKLSELVPGCYSEKRYKALQGAIEVLDQRIVKDS